MNREKLKFRRTRAVTARTQGTGKTAGRHLTQTIEWEGSFFEVRKPGPGSAPRRLREVTRLTQHLRRFAQEKSERARAPLVIAASASAFPKKAAKVIAELDSGAPVTLDNIEAWTGWPRELSDWFVDYGLVHVLKLNVVRIARKNGDQCWLPLGHRYLHK